MDWSPTQQVHLPPPTSYRDSRQTPSKPTTQKSPFYGQLPQNVVSPAHALRNPPYQPAPLQRAAAQQNNFFARNNASPFKNFARRTFDDDDATSATASPVSNRFSNNAFQNQTFFPTSANADTGLEDLFAKATTLRVPSRHLNSAQQGDDETERTSQASDISEEYRKRRARSADRATRRREWRVRGGLLVIAVLVLGFAVQMAWCENVVREAFSGWAGEVRCRVDRKVCDERM